MTEALILIGMVVSAIASMIDGIQRKRIADLQAQPAEVNTEVPDDTNLPRVTTAAVVAGG